MSSQEIPIPTTCKICANIIFKEDHTIHFGCVATREKSLLEIVSFLHEQMDVMKKSFNAVKNVLETLEDALYIENVEFESGTETDSEIRPRTLRKTTIAKSKSLKADLRRGTKSSLPNSGLTLPISPLAVPNATSPSHQVTVTPSVSKRNTTNTAVSKPPTSASQPPSFNSSLYQHVDTSTSRTAVSLTNDMGIPVAILPRSVFLSRIGPSVTIEQVEDYIRRKIPSASHFSARKMLFKDPREYSSFEITIRKNIDLFDTILRPDFWPTRAIVKEFKRFLKPPGTYSDLQ